MTTIHNTKTAEQADWNEANDLGLQERQLMMQLTGPQPRLDYPTEIMRMSNGCEVERYIIPDADKQKVFNTIYPFSEQPALEEEMIDIHTNKTFKVNDYIVTREGNGNFLVTPYYAEAGGTVLDWIRPEENNAQQTQNTLNKASTICLRTIVR